MGFLKQTILAVLGARAVSGARLARFLLPPQSNACPRNTTPKQCNPSCCHTSSCKSSCCYPRAIQLLFLPHQSNTIYVSSQYHAMQWLESTRIDTGFTSLIYDFSELSPKKSQRRTQHLLSPMQKAGSKIRLAKLAKHWLECDVCDA